MSGYNIVLVKLINTMCHIMCWFVMNSVMLYRYVVIVLYVSMHEAINNYVKECLYYSNIYSLSITYKYIKTRGSESSRRAVVSRGQGK